MGPKPNSYKETETCRDTKELQGGPGHRMTETEISVNQLEAKECQGLPATTRISDKEDKNLPDKEGY